MKPVYFILTILFFLGVNFYVFYRLVYMLPAVTVLRSIVTVIGIVAVLSFFGYFLGRDIFPQRLILFMHTVSSSWVFMMIYFTIIFLVLDILRVIPAFPAGYVLHKNLISLVSIVGLVAVIFIYGHRKYLNKERVELNLEVNKSVGQTTPIKIVALSDLHLGSNIGRDELAGWVELINKEDPDIVLIAGDIIDSDVRSLYDQNMAEVFKRIKSKYGVYTIMGNHEYISGVNRSAEFFGAAGIRLLRDASELIDNKFYVVGRDDRSHRGRKPIRELIDSLDKSKPIILLDHQPYELEAVSPHGIDLQISGHTHHGQVWPISWITDAIYELSHGHLKKENTHFYVSSGIGVWGGKYRINTQSEYVVINLGRFL
ncbi:MAG: metallophosphoesterase [Mediterranea sp.]|jgi:predicted MPP superfamily phosphohydrolase|nr:metallophosphoesterase [Mediterranea sp.]